MSKGSNKFLDTSDLPPIHFRVSNGQLTLDMRVGKHHFIDPGQVIEWWNFTTVNPDGSLSRRSVGGAPDFTVSILAPTELVLQKKKTTGGLQPSGIHSARGHNHSTRVPRLVPALRTEEKACDPCVLY